MAMDELVAGRLTVEDVQRRLQTSMGLLERDGSDIASAIHLAEADLEEIRVYEAH
ncbi:MAG TPA: hypothetical protein VFV67_08385 [Actinophytocola sp.]|uniref:hypothetical protein n=1 Tax=Actinophytocola sp. TaxID=1872138 RepID=UPI002DB6410D|nr:hypothetical protein [Actinophytocola sp.]HEU5470657.1 hypothetical protein [Actinophytocola sp.]